MVSLRLPVRARRLMTLIKMCIRGFVILAASFAVTMAETSKLSAVETAIDSINQFSPTFFKEASSSNPGNLIISPILVSIALAIFGYGSSDKTKEEFQRVVHLPEELVGKIGYADLIKSVNAAESADLRLSNKIFIDDQHTIEDSYLELIQNTFHSTIQDVNFTNVQEAINKINEYIKENIKDRHTDILTPDILPEYPNMAVVSVVYFHAYWGTRFSPLHGGKKPFYVTKKQSKDLFILHNRGNYSYGRFPELKATLVELPYEDKEFSMILILPNAIDGLAEVEKKLAERDLASLVEALNVTDVAVSIPKFKIESTLNLIPPLKKMGIKRAFNEDTADFFEIFDLGLYIDSFVEKASIAVDAKGSAAAISSRILDDKPASTIFYIDHPFHLSILKKDKLTNKKFELISARVVDPQ